MDRISFRAIHALVILMSELSLLARSTSQKPHTPGAEQVNRAGHVLRPTGRFWTTLAAIAMSAVAPASPARADAPRQLYNKTIQISWTVDQVAHTADGQSRNRAIAANQTIYVSSAGRLFMRSSRVNGTKSSQSEMAPGASQNGSGESAGVRFQGNQLIGTTAFAQGARQFVATFDGGFSSCKVTVSFGRDGGGLKRVGITGEMLTIDSMKPHGESCVIRDGNAL
jgi:hypothetical protein